MLLSTASVAIGDVAHVNLMIVYTKYMNEMRSRFWRARAVFSRISVERDASVCATSSAMTVVLENGKIARNIKIQMQAIKTI